MNKNGSKIVILAVLAVLILSAGAMANPREQRGPKGRRPAMEQSKVAVCPVSEKSFHRGGPRDTQSVKGKKPLINKKASAPKQSNAKRAMPPKGRQVGDRSPMRGKGRPEGMQKRRGDNMHPGMKKGHGMQKKRGMRNGRGMQQKRGGMGMQKGRQAGRERQQMRGERGAGRMQKRGGGSGYGSMRSGSRSRFGGMTQQGRCMRPCCRLR